MEDRILAESRSSGRMKLAAMCFLPALVLLLGGGIWSLLYYGGNADLCRSYVQSAFPGVSRGNGYWMFMRIIMQFGMFCKAIPLCIYWGIVLLIIGSCQFAACRSGEMRLGTYMITGKTRFGNRVFLPVSKVEKAEKGPCRSIILHIPGGKLVFPWLEKREVLWEHLEQMEEKGKAGFSAYAAGKTPCPLQLREKAGGPGTYGYFLPAALMLAALLLCIRTELPGSWAYYWSEPRIQERQSFYSFVIASVIGGLMGHGAALCLLGFFLTLTAGGLRYMCCSRTELTADGGYIWGRGNYGSTFRFPASAISAVSAGRGKTLILYHAGGKTAVGRLSGREQAYSCIAQWMGQTAEGEKKNGL